MRAVREQRGLSLLAVEAASAGEFKASSLGSYERGDRAISVTRLQRLADLYEVPIDALFPELPLGVSSSMKAARAHGHGVGIDLSRLRAVTEAEAATLRHFVTSVQRDRQDFNGRLITVRDDDVRAIAAAMGIAAEDLLSRLRALGLLATDEGAGKDARRGRSRRTAGDADA
jgi:transcriptional regulator with XRE-family HTH domain